MGCAGFLPFATLNLHFRFGANSDRRVNGCGRFRTARVMTANVPNRVFVLYSEPDSNPPNNHKVNPTWNSKRPQIARTSQVRFRDCGVWGRRQTGRQLP